MITLREVVAKYNSLGVPDSVYKGVIRQTDNFVTRMKIDLTDVPGDILTAGINIKKEDGTTNTGGLIVTYPIPGQPKKFYVDISNWFTNVPGTLEITVQALASMNGLTQVFNCSKITFCIEGTATELDPTVVPEFFNVLSVNGYAGVIDITHENIGDGAEIVVEDVENTNNFKHRTIKAGTNIVVTENENDISLDLDDTNVGVLIDEHIDEHNNDAVAHPLIGEALSSLENEKVDKVAGQSLISDADKEQITTNKNAIDDINNNKLPLKADTDNVLPNSHDTSESAHDYIRTLINEVRVIAEGRLRAKSFLTEQECFDYVTTNLLDLQVGDNFYIEEVDKPDYWWNGSALVELGIDKLNLADYYKKTETFNKTEVEAKLIHNHDNSYEPINANIQVHIGTTTGNPHGVKFADLSDKPTKVSDLTNDSEFITVNDIPTVPTVPDVEVYNGAEEAGKYISELNVDAANKHKVNVVKKTLPVVPSKTSELENDSEFITESDLPEPTPQYDDTDLKSRLSAIEEIIESIDGETDADNVINKLHEIVALLDGYAEGTTLVELLGSKVDKIADKGLTKNELTDELKAEYDEAYTHSQEDHAPSGAQVNAIENIKVDDTSVVVTDKTAYIYTDKDVITHLYAGENLAVHDLVIIGVDGKWYKIANTTINSKMDSPIGRVSKAVTSGQLAMVHIRGKFALGSTVTQYATKQLGQTLYLRGAWVDKNIFKSDGTIINGLGENNKSYKAIGIWLTDTDVYLLPNQQTYSFDSSGKLFAINGLEIKDTIPTIPTISTSISADASSDTKTASPKAVKEYVDSLIITGLGGSY